MTEKPAIYNINLTDCIRLLIDIDESGTLFKSLADECLSYLRNNRDSLEVMDIISRPMYARCGDVQQRYEDLMLTFRWTMEPVWQTIDAPIIDRMRDWSDEAYQAAVAEDPAADPHPVGRVLLHADARQELLDVMLLHAASLETEAADELPIL